MYQSNEDTLPDSELEPGQHSHLVVGNHGRLLDSRRTPVRIVDLSTSLGMFMVQIEDFEDRGAIWEVPFEEVHRYQFAKAEKRASQNVLSEIKRSVERLDRPLRIACDSKTRAATAARFQTLSAEVSSWIDSGDERATGVLYRQCVPIERLFMTYYETEQMNRSFAEAEAVLLYDEDNVAF
jgi:hypothetical protein